MKAKDLLKRNNDDSELDEVHELPDPDEDGTPKRKSHEDDKVTAAYEEINRKLSALRSGKSADDEAEDGERKTEDSEEDEELDPLDSEIPVVDQESEGEEADELDPVDKLEEEDLKEEEPDDDESKSQRVNPSTHAQDHGESDQLDEESEPRKTFESSSPAPRQFRTSNIQMDEDTLSKKDDGPFDSLDDLAESEDQPPAQNRELPPRMSQNDDQPMRRPQMPEEDDGLDIPPLNAPKQQYNFSEPTNRPAQPEDQANTDLGPRGYSNRRNNNSFGGEFQHRSSRGKGSAIFQLLILLLIGAAVIGGTVYFLKNQFKTGSNPQPSPTPTTQIITPAPTPTPTPNPIDRSKFKLRVLNGTDKTGLAGTVADKLKGLGYGIDRTGNATNSAFEKTIVRVKENSASLSGQLIQDLSPDYTPDVQVTLKSSDTIDSEIILGQK